MSHTCTEFSHQPVFHTVQPIPFKAPRVQGLSAALLENHYVNHYGAAVQRLNCIEKEIAQRDGESTHEALPQGAGLELLSTSTIVNLHETYFDSIGENGGDPMDATLIQLMIRDFGSVEQWRREFTELSASMINDPGWVVLVWSNRLNRLLNLRVDGDVPFLSDAHPVLALDLHEYSYSLDYAVDARQYIDAFMDTLHWGRIGARLQKIRIDVDQDHAGEEPVLENPALSISVTELKALIDGATTKPMVVDVRHTDDRVRQGRRIVDTPWRDSYQVPTWAVELPKDQRIVVYCAYGFWVSQEAAAQLREQGYDACSLDGGLTAWCAMDYPSDRIDN